MSIQTELEARNVKLQGILDDTNAAITAKGGTQAATLSDLPEAVGALPEGGEEVFFDSYCGCGYTKNVVYPRNNNVARVYQECAHLETFSAPNFEISYPYNNAEYFCTYNENLRTLDLPVAKSFGHYNFQYNTGLKEVTCGSIGNPMEGGGLGYSFRGVTQSDVVFTIYTSAATLEEANTLHSGGPASWGATNATVIYRDATTGEVITA